MTESGEILSISIYHNGSTDGSKVLLGIYDDASGLPGSRLGTTVETTVHASEGWQTIEMTAPVFAGSGQTIWLAWVFENNPGIRYRSGTPGRAQSFDGWIGGMPLSYGTSSLKDYIYSIYAEYTPGSGGLKSQGQILGEETFTFEKEHFNVFPNPVNMFTHVTWKGGYKEGLNLMLINSVGEVVELLTVPPQQKQIRINFDDKMPGVYFLFLRELEGNQIVFRSKIIKGQ
jgi:hypothetical protein